MPAESVQRYPIVCLSRNECEYHDFDHTHIYCTEYMMQVCKGVGNALRSVIRQEGGSKGPYFLPRQRELTSK